MLNQVNEVPVGKLGPATIGCTAFTVTLLENWPLPSVVPPLA
jgi:hypothetical protein